MAEQDPDEGEVLVVDGPAINGGAVYLIEYFDQPHNPSVGSTVTSITLCARYDANTVCRCVLDL